MRRAPVRQVTGDAIKVLSGQSSDAGRIDHSIRALATRVDSVNSGCISNCQPTGRNERLQACATPKTTPVTFILAGHKLVTVRYDEPKPFALITNKLARACAPTVSGESIMMDLLDAVIDRAADILERAGADIDRASHDIFEPEGRRTDRTITYRYILRAIGRKGDLTSKVRESLVSIGRLVLFLANEADGMKWPKEMRSQLKTMQRDVQSLSDHASYLGNKVTFLLDAMIGVMSVEQNNIIKLFSVAAVVLMPPTLVASIYGMNFKHMPELDWTLGYPLALVLMLVAAVLPYWFFKWKRWL